MTAYMPRIADALLAEKLASTGAVLVDGARATGKTRMAEIVAKSSVYLDRDPADRAAMRLDPATLLVGEPPTLIDEWQLEANRVWGYVRGQVDVRQAPGQFILTGSTTPESDLGRHSGVGRIARLRVRPMSTFESGESDGTISLARLMEGADVPGVRGADSLADVARRVVRGGWPTAVTRATKTAGQFAVDYVESVAEVDLGPLTDRKRNPERIKRLLRALARNTAMEHKIARIADETDGGQGALARATVYEHLDLLDRVMVLENQPAWGPHLRSRAPLRTAARTHFVDASLAAAALNADEARLVRDLETFGLLFESHVLRDLRVYSQPLRATVSHYRDGNGLEVDAVVTDAGGRWGAIQIKLGQGSVDEAAASLLRLAQVVDTSVTGEPQFLAVLTAIGHGYTRPDGVVVVPIGALGP